MAWCIYGSHSSITTITEKEEESEGDLLLLIDLVITKEIV